MPRCSLHEEQAVRSEGKVRVMMRLSDHEPEQLVVLIRVDEISDEGGTQTLGNRGAWSVLAIRQFTSNSLSRRKSSHSDRRDKPGTLPLSAGLENLVTSLRDR